MTTLNKFQEFMMEAGKLWAGRFELQPWAIPSPQPRKEENMYFDRKGQPMTLEEWAKAFEDKEYKRVAVTSFKDSPITVSTVWLGLEHGWVEGQPGILLPLIFETMAFGLPDDAELQMRNPTEEDALAEHAEAVRQLMAKYNLEPITTPVEEVQPQVTFQVTYEDE